MNEDIRVSLDFWDHHKTVRLKMKLGYEGIEALQRLWFYTAKFRPDGHLINMDEIDISIACKWQGKVKDLMEILTDKKYPWLDWRDDHYHLHNWEKRNGYAIHAEARSEKARRAAYTRWEKRNKGKGKQHDNAKCITEHDAKNAISNAPFPAPIPSPNPTPPPLGKSNQKNHSRFSFEEWKKHIKTSFDLLLSDQKWLDTMIERYPRTNIPATIEEARDYWIGREGYDKKKGSKNCNWKTILQNTFKTDWLKVPKDIPQTVLRQKNGIHSNNGLHQAYLIARQAAYDKFKSTLNLDELRSKFQDDWLSKDPEYITLYPDWEKRLEPHFQHKLSGYIEGEVDFPSFDQWKARAP